MLHSISINTVCNYCDYVHTFMRWWYTCHIMFSSCRIMQFLARWCNPNPCLPLASITFEEWGKCIYVCVHGRQEKTKKKLDPQVFLYAYGTCLLVWHVLVISKLNIARRLLPYSSAVVHVQCMCIIYIVCTLCKSLSSWLLLDPLHCESVFKAVTHPLC